MPSSYQGSQEIAGMLGNLVGKLRDYNDLLGTTSLGAGLRD